MTDTSGVPVTGKKDLTGIINSTQGSNGHSMVTPASALIQARATSEYQEFIVRIVKPTGDNPGAVGLNEADLLLLSAIADYDQGPMGYLSAAAKFDRLTASTEPQHPYHIVAKDYLEIMRLPLDKLRDMDQA